MFMTTVNVYLTFNGNCEEAFNFYKSVFGGVFPYVGRFGEMPADAGPSLPPEEANKIMHISLPISKETMLMGSDTGGEWASHFKVGNKFLFRLTPTINIWLMCILMVCLPEDRSPCQ
jgi:PhnB protein